MNQVKNFRKMQCSACLNGEGFDYPFTMAFQPIVDVKSRTVFAQEALVRGLGDLPARVVFEHVNDENRYAFDQACRVKAVKLASQLNISSLVSINFMPNAVYKPELCIRTTLEAAEQYNFPADQIMFEVTEGEKVLDIDHLQNIFVDYNERGFITALDDFGAGYSGLNLLAGLDVKVLKLDMELISNIDTDKRKQAIVKGIVTTCGELGVKIIAEGVEKKNELLTVIDIGINLVQGYYLARPSYESLAKIDWEAALD
ncbi:EAL domain-containing protein [Pontibacter sp. JAM-7]|uniref:EAL domain-containing protein n=1 Tax=Pontibacter sp. JAM-7 TaxID=3366581 RepID=UPI003AF60A20